MVISPLALLVAVVGLVLYLTITHAKWAEVGRILLFCGVLALLLANGQHTVSLF